MLITALDSSKLYLYTLRVPKNQRGGDNWRDGALLGN